MNPDYLFTVVGVIGMCAGAACLLSSLSRTRRRNWLPGLLWTCFAAGLLARGLAPNLKIENRRFIITQVPSVSQPFDPKPLVERERQMHMLSALLTAGAAVGLALCYRDFFIRSN